MEQDGLATLRVHGDVARAPVRLGALEAQVMDVLWDRGPATVREVITELGSGSAYTTIATVLSNLGRKGLVVASRENRSTRYAAGVGRHEHTAQVMALVLAASRDHAATMLHFVDALSPQDLALLRGYLSQRDPVDC